jgi:hypothetical protein
MTIVKDRHYICTCKKRRGKLPKEWRRGRSEVGGSVGNECGKGMCAGRNAERDNALDMKVVCTIGFGKSVKKRK